MKWNKQDIDLSIKLIKEGKNFVEIALILNRTQNSVTKKLNRLGYNSVYTPKQKGKTKYSTLDWGEIQNKYDNGFTYRDLIKEYKLTPQAIMWAKENKKLNFRSGSDAIKLAWQNGKFKESEKEGVERYRQLCEFKFNLKDYPDEFDFALIEGYGWYKAKNRGDNPNGVSRDHMYSVKRGYLNNIDPYYISHPANCKLMRHNDNNRKKIDCSLTIEELIERVNKWDEKYGQK